MKKIMNSALGSIGFVLLLLGAAAGDSESLLPTVLLVVIGLAMLAVSAANEKNSATD